MTDCDHGDDLCEHKIQAAIDSIQNWQPRPKIRLCSPAQYKHAQEVHLDWETRWKECNICFSLMACPFI